MKKEVMMFKRLSWIFIGAFLLCTVLTASSSAGDITLTLEVSPDSYTGTCPVVLSFGGKITASEPGDIKFKFMRSDGASSEEKLLSFTEPGLKEITTTWTLSGSYSGWMTIKVLSPQVIESERAEFKVVCQTGVRPADRIIAKRKALTPQQTVVMKKPAVIGAPSMLVPGLVIGLRHSENQKDDAFTIPQLEISLPLVQLRDMCIGDFCLEENFLCWIVPCSPSGNPEDWKLPQGIAVALKHTEKRWLNPLITVFGYDPIEGPDLLPGGGFKKMFGGDRGAPANHGYYWYETTGEGFTDWSLVNQLPRGTVIGLKHSLNQRIKRLVWNGNTYDPYDSRINPPPGFARKFGGDIGARSGEGYYWYEKTTDHQ